MTEQLSAAARRRARRGDRLVTRRTGGIPRGNPSPLVSFACIHCSSAGRPCGRASSRLRDRRRAGNTGRRATFVGFRLPNVGRTPAARWRQALRSAGAPQCEPLRGDWSARSGYELGHRLAQRPGVTAVFCANDQMSLGLLRALCERGIRVPDDVSVVGFDDIPESEFFLPPLTTVRQDFGELGRRALRLIVDRIDGMPVPSPSILLAPELIVRASAVPAGQ